jgi:hypothetical protein
LIRHEAMRQVVVVDARRLGVARLAMPPQPGVWVGRDETIKGWVAGGFGRGDYADWQCRTTMANGQPAVAICRSSLSGVTLGPRIGSG